MFAWSKLDPDGVSGVGRYAARGCLSYLESSSILPARTFLSHFLALVLAASPSLLVVRFPFPPPGSALAKALPAGAPADEVVVTALASLNFVQLALRSAQAGVGETVDKARNERGEVGVAKGGGRAVWKGLVSRYEREVAWLREVDAKEVSWFRVVLGLTGLDRALTGGFLVCLNRCRVLPSSDTSTLGSSHPARRATPSWTVSSPSARRPAPPGPG